MKSVQEVMDEKLFFKKENSSWSISGFIHLVPTERVQDVMSEVDSAFTDMFIVDKKSGQSMLIPEFDDWAFRDLLWEFRCRAVEVKHKEWYDAVRHHKKYDLFAAYQNALSDYAYATRWDTNE
jgi:hypothetical protein